MFIRAFILFIFLLYPVLAIANVFAVDENKGYFVDETNQIEKDALKVEYNGTLEVQPSATIVPFNKYFKEATGESTRKPYKMPLIPNYNTYYSERRAYSHTKEQFINVYCTGEKRTKGMDCFDDEYVVTFVKVEDWSYGVIKAPIKAKLHHRKGILFLMVHNVVRDSEYMSEVKKWSEMTKFPVIFATIDTFIPEDWIM